MPCASPEPRLRLSRSRESLITLHAGPGRDTVAVMWRLIRIVVLAVGAVVALAIATPVVVYAPMVARCTEVAEDWYSAASAAVRSPSTRVRRAMSREPQGWYLSGHVSSKLMTDNHCLGSDKRTLERHIDVLVLSGWLRTWFSDDQIAALYFSRSYMGPGIYGWDEAARAYYGRELQKLGDEELQCLARRARNPSRPRCDHR
jgi:hypothetical protein